MTENSLAINCLVFHVHKCITDECNLVCFKLMLVILIVIVANIVFALWVYLHIYYIVMVSNMIYPS